MDNNEEQPINKNTKNVLITGGTGFIGQYLSNRLVKEKYNIIILTRNKAKYFNYVNRQIKLISSLNEIDEPIHIIVNLAGEPLDKKRWSSSFKKKIIQSRTKMTKDLVRFFNKENIKPKVVINASAIGYYGNNPEICDEESEPMPNFSHKLCAAWEEEAREFNRKLESRLCILRFGVVLGPNHGMIKALLPAFKRGLGGNLGNGQQTISWIHIDDLINIIVDLIQHDNKKGVYNCVSPKYTTNAEFTKLIGKYLNKPTFFHIPKFIVKLLFGEMAKELFFNSPKVIPKKLTESGFKFKHSTIDSALKDIL